MPIITLPDGSKREFDRPVSVLEVAQDIGAGLAKATIAGRVNGVRHDACDIINEDANLEIITAKDEDGLEIIRHSCTRLRLPSTTLTATATVSPGAKAGICLPRREISSCSSWAMRFMLEDSRHHVRGCCWDWSRWHKIGPAADGPARGCKLSF